MTKAAQEIEIGGGTSVHYLPGAKSLVVGSEVGSARPTATKNTDELTETVAGKKIAPWGEGNDKPQQVYKKVKEVAAIVKSLGLLTRMMSGQGIRYGFVTGFDKDGNEQLEYKANDEIDTFMRRNNINTRYLPEAILDLKWFGNVFPELLFSEGAAEKILGCVVQEAPFCRWESWNKQGYSENCIISSMWPSPGEQFAVVPSFDVYEYNRVETVRKRKLKKAVYPLSFPSPMKSYYQEPEWWSIIDSGWLEQLLSIPKLKEAIIKNQMTIKYLIRIPESYWPDKYKDWSKITAEKQDKLRGDELKKLNEMLSGTENSGSSIITHFKTLQTEGKDYAKWEIEPIENPIKDGLYNPDSQEATAQALYGVGIDPTIIGLSIGKGMGAGSGSDKRVAYNILDALSTLERQIILEPLYFIAQYNNWPPNLRWFIPGHQVATLDTGNEMEPTPKPVA